MLPLTTNSALLQDLCDFDNRTLWTDFDARYRRVVVGFARQLGLGADEATEVAQETLVQFARDFRRGRYDRSLGRLSAWILGIARHRVLDMMRRRGRKRVSRGSSALLALQAPEPYPDHWEDECRQAVFDRALAELRAETRTRRRTLQVFEQVAIQGIAPAEVARALGMSVDQVHRIKHRITDRLRQIVSRLQREYEVE